ncbi:MAG TPA: VWA domain-containing protein [Anaerolineales bacterium]|nr:VWA domain-containing protein [Anaerolineales bacterium]
MEAPAFLHNLLLFGRLLRGLGLDVNPGRMIDLVHALDHIEIGRKNDFYYAARTFLVHDREDLPLFDQAFEMFWHKPVEDWINFSLGGLLIKRRPPRPRTAPPPLSEQGDDPDSQQNPDSSEQQPVLIVTRTYSDREILRRKNFADLTGEELDAVKRMMRELTLQMGERRTRRLRPGRGERPDLRRTLRQSYKTGGEVMIWATREPKFKPRPLVIIADISGSMERYTRLLLHFIYGLAQAHNQPVEAFVFSTRLTRITRQLQYKNMDQALHEVSDVVHDWAGGTRTGDSLKTFNYDWGRRVLGRGAVVLVISDGWDRGDPELLTKEMARLHRTCHRLVWLNPLLGSPVYEPLTRGIQAALPHVDDFLPVHNLASLEDLAAHLEKIRLRS